MKNQGDTITNLGETRLACHYHPKYNILFYVLFFYQYALYVPKLSVIFNQFTKSIALLIQHLACSAKK